MTQVVAGEFAELYRTHFGRIAGQLAAYLGDHAEAQDLTQEAFCRALDRWGTVSRFADAPAWVRTVAWNLATSRLRHLRVRARHLARLREEHVAGPGPERVALTRALADLPPNQRVAVVLYHLGGLSTVEIAEQQGVPEGTVRSWLTRGRSRLAELLAEAKWDSLEAGDPPAQGVDAARRAVRRRRAGRGAAIAAVAVALAVIAALVLHGRAFTPPVIGPTTSPTVQTRAINLPGVGRNTPPVLQFADHAHGWVVYDTCWVIPAGPCTRVLGKTGDGGRSWSTVPLPQIQESAPPLMMEVIDADTMILIVSSRTSGLMHYLQTTDGGRTFAEISPWPRHSGCFLRDNTACRHRRLPATLPQGWPSKSGISYAYRGGDGRIWLTHESTERPTTMAVSADGAATWKAVPWPESGVRLHLSPNGKDVWVTGKQEFYQLVGDEWKLRHTLAAQEDTYQLVYLGGEVWFGWIGPDLGYLRNWTLTETVQFPGAHKPEVLADGTIVVPTIEGAYIGTGGSWAYIAG